MDIERLATSAVIERISFCDGLSPFINDGDKEPSFDGHIYVYPKDSKKKSELLARVPVQVKGKNKKIKKATSSLAFSAEVSDLKNYVNEGGVIYFVVAINSDRSKQIFYKTLLPFDLHGILKYAGNNETKSINLKRLPDDDKAIRQILLSFIADKKRQAAQIVWSEEQAIMAARDGASFNFHIQPLNNVKHHYEIMRELTIQSFYIYVKTKEGIEFPFTKVDDEHIIMTKHTIDIPVFVGDVKYYDCIQHGYENGNRYIYIGEILRIPFAGESEEPKRHTFNYKLKGMLSQRIADSDFLLALSQYKRFRIGELEHEVNMNNKDEISWLKDLNAEFKMLKATLDYFGVKDDLDISILTETDNQNIAYLMRAADGNKMSYVEKDIPSLFYNNIKIGNILIRILADKCENSDKYKLSNAFSDKAHVRMEYVNLCGDKVIVEPWSLYLHMKSEDFLCSNIDYEVILDSIKTMKPEDLGIAIGISVTQSINATNMLLEIIRAYDSQARKNKLLLKFAIDMADVLLDKNPASIINKMQAIKRQRSLSNDEIASLVNLRNERDQTKVVICAVSILLDEIENAEKLLNELSENEKKQITDYPIYSLFK